MQHFTRRQLLHWLPAALLTPSLLAQDETIVIQGSQKIELTLGTLSGADGPATAQHLKKALALTGTFHLTPGAANVLTGSASGGSLQATLKAATGAAFTRSFSGGARAAALACTDAVLESLAGCQGFLAASRVAFVAPQNGSKEIHLMDIDGANPRQITGERSICLGPRFSPDGNRILYTGWKSGKPRIWMIDLAAKKIRQLTDFPGTNTSAAFSPDGARIALTLSKSGNTELYVLPLEGGEPARLTRTQGTETSPTWSPDGAEIAYISDDRGSPQLQIIPSSGGAPRRLNTRATYTTEPAWSPDGRTLAYSVQTAGQLQIGLLQLSSGKTALLTSGGSNESPAWTRNSRHLVFARSGKIHILDSLTGAASPVENGISSCTQPHCSR